MAAWFQWRHCTACIQKLSDYLSPSFAADGILPHRVLSPYSLTAAAPLLDFSARRSSCLLVLLALSPILPAATRFAARRTNSPADWPLNRDRILWMNSFMRISVGAQRFPTPPPVSERFPLVGWWCCCVATTALLSNAETRMRISSSITMATITMTTFMATLKTRLRCNAANGYKTPARSKLSTP